jgi:hypothetical protein
MAIPGVAHPLSPLALPLINLDRACHRACRPYACTTLVHSACSQRLPVDATHEQEVRSFSDHLF